MMWYRHGDFLIYVDSEPGESDEKMKKAVENLRLWLRGKL